MRNLWAVGFSVALFLALILGLEGVFRLNAKWHWLAPARPAQTPDSFFDWPRTALLRSRYYNPTIYRWRSNLDETKDASAVTEGIDFSELGQLPESKGRTLFLPTRPLRSREFTLRSHRPIFDVLVTPDKVGRRQTPLAQNAAYNILMFGDSYTFGWGVNDEETSAYQLAHLRREASVYNLGYGGNGPGAFLYWLDSDKDPRLRDIKKIKTLALFTAIDDHMERLICRSPCLNAENDFWEANKPYYTLEAGAPRLRGFFDSDRARMNSFYSLLNASSFLNFLNFAWPIRFNSVDFDLFAALMAEAKIRIREHFPDSEFYVVFFPGEMIRYGPQVRAACEKKGISVLDYSRLAIWDLAARHSYIVGDGHPSPTSQYVYARLLNDDLPKPGID
jgi:hypothetical protein